VLKKKILPNVNAKGTTDKWKKKRRMKQTTRQIKISSKTRILVPPLAGRRNERRRTGQVRRGKLMTKNYYNFKK
jgi:hypothetical protein